MKFVFSPDIYRNSCLPTVQKYQEILAFWEMVEDNIKSERLK